MDCTVVAMAAVFSQEQLLHISEMIRTALRTEGQAQMQGIVNIGTQQVQAATEGFLRQLVRALQR